MFTDQMASLQKQNSRRNSS